jgi:hypothetical protein
MIGNDLAVVRLTVFMFSMNVSWLNYLRRIRFEIRQKIQSSAVFLLIRNMLK